MMLTSADILSSSTIYSNRSTYATCYERNEIRQVIDNEWYRAAAINAGYKTPPTITLTNLEPFSDYLCPEPIRSRKIKLKIISKSKGLPVNYNEYNEDFL